MLSQRLRFPKRHMDHLVRFCDLKFSTVGLMVRVRDEKNDGSHGNITERVSAFQVRLRTVRGPFVKAAPRVRKLKGQLGLENWFVRGKVGDEYDEAR